MSDEQPARPPAEDGDAEAEQRPPITATTVEALVRAQMASALGGRRGIAETAIPGLAFTAIWLTTKDLTLALQVSIGLAAVALVLRLIDKSSVQYVLNAAFSIGIGWVFVRIADSGGGSESEQALAFFLPGILYSGVYTLLMIGTILVGWPLLGFMLGTVTGDPTAWHDNKQIVRLCSRLTWLMLAPGAFGVLTQGPIWFLGWSGSIEQDTAVAIIAALRYGVGWPIRIASWSAMFWLLARNATPLEEVSEG